MVNLYFNDNLPLVKLYWEVYKGQSSVREDFSRATIWLWLLTSTNKIPIDATTNKGVILAELPTTLAPDVYSIKAIWSKSGTFDFDQNDILNGKQLGIETRVTSLIQDAFTVVDSAEKATKFGEDAYLLKYRSHAATYGYDGLDAYELAVMRGKTNLSEEEWLDQLNGGVTPSVIINNKWYNLN